MRVDVKDFLLAEAADVRRGKVAIWLREDRRQLGHHCRDELESPVLIQKIPLDRANVCE